MGLLKSILAGIQYLLPHHLLSSVVHWFLRIRVMTIKNVQIALFSEVAGIDWSESKLKSASDFESFNAFFTRELAAGARPIDSDPSSFVAPSDGKISQCGRLTNNRIVQAKGQHYSLRNLLANDPAASDFHDGFFHTIYLAPRNYHRVHMPMSGHLQRMIHVPGRLFSVAPYSVQRVPGLFTRNERVISLFETSHGPMALILIGAMLVSSMETTWSGVITPPRGKRVTTGDWSRRDIRLEKGQEMGRFNMGSTVILLLPAGAVSTLAYY
ncbi:MAG: archaetidylserine decarboxylase, partial [Lysobacterales bacterium]